MEWIPVYIAIVVFLEILTFRNKTPSIKCTILIILLMLAFLLIGRQTPLTTLALIVAVTVIALHDKKRQGLLASEEQILEQQEAPSNEEQTLEQQEESVKEEQTLDWPDVERDLKKAALWLRFLKSKEREAAMGDLLESYQYAREHHTPKEARRLIRYHAFNGLWPVFALWFGRLSKLAGFAWIASIIKGLIEAKIK